MASGCGIAAPTASVLGHQREGNAGTQHSSLSVPSLGPQLL